MKTLDVVSGPGIEVAIAIAISLLASIALIILAVILIRKSNKKK